MINYIYYEKMKKNINHYILSAALACILPFAACSSGSSDEPTDVPTPPEAIEPQAPVINQTKILNHPRLLFTASEEEKLHELIESDPLAKRMKEFVIANADKLLSAPLIPYKLDGRGTMLNISRAHVQRFILFSLAHRLTHETQYATAVNRLLKHVCSYPDWNKSHYLDTSEMTAAVAIAIDWLYDVLPAETKMRAISCIKKRALDSAVKEYQQGGSGSWAKRETNWNVVCNAGMVLGALAVADDYPVVAENIINNAVKFVPNCLKHFAPDGICYEGPAYWEYTNDYLALLLKTLQDNFQTDYGISQLQGISQTAYFYVQSLSPTNKVFNFADSGSTTPSISPVFLVFSRLFHQPAIAGWYRGQLEEALKKSSNGNRFFALALPWLVGTPSHQEQSPKPRLQTFKGINDIVVFNGTRQVPHSIYLIAKGADPDMAHQQLDGGSFVLETDGIRWIEDLGSENYALPGFWEYYGRRWNYFLNTNLSHNTLNIDGQLQNPRGTAHIHQEETSGNQPYAVLDMTTLYADQVSKAFRKFQLTDDTTIEVTDDIALKDASSIINWLVATRARVDIKGKKAILSKDGRQLILEIRSPETATWTTYPAKPNSDKEKPLPGVTMVECKYAPQTTHQVSLHIRIQAGN